MLVYLSVAGMWVFKAHHIFSLHFVCSFFIVKLWSHGACYTPTMAWKGVVSRLLRAGSHTVAVCFSYGIFVGPWKWAGWQERPSLLWPSLVITEVLKRVGRSAKGWKQKYRKICLGRDHSDQMIKQLRFLIDEALYIWILYYLQRWKHALDKAMAGLCPWVH